MNLNDTIQYINGGDACCEEEMIGLISDYFNFTNYQRFELCYFQSITYNIPSALDIFFNRSIDKRLLKFRTDRRWVAYLDRYEQLMANLTRDKYETLQAIDNYQDAHDFVRTWYYFARYATFLFLEIYIQALRPLWVDNLIFKYEKNELYTKGAQIIANNSYIQLNEVQPILMKSTGINSFGLETVLCGVAKIEKGTRWDGFYKARMIDNLKHIVFIFIGFIKHTL